MPAPLRILRVPPRRAHTKREGEGMKTDYAIELWQSGEMVAAVYSSSLITVLEHASTYARVYSKDGPIRVKVKNPKEPRHDR